ncbi:ComEA family DNA-binding protein [Thiohalomonas denitrificans]|uniref:Competence protein ComEA n=1 Tax=Thiohalomonas denitrificans TaxID=415747 RepID=A0A1G5PI32_9GAMM|nr:ComEA family DNA-binding protein [Thiohalomonas denitrificans]SCZ49175.1 competence protein ComEA [Thiohalomonas denitrificans]
MRNFSFIIVAISILFSAAVSAQPVNINTAGPEVLAEAINGVGPARAEAIVAYREQHGPFKSVEDLREIKGIGPVLLESNRDKLLVTSD